MSATRKRDGCPCAPGNRAHCRGMMRYDEPLHLSSPAADALPADHVRLAASAYLARFTGSSREHTESDLRCYLRWCADRGLDPLAARRPDLEQYIRWMQETCRFKPSTISRRFSVAAGFCRTCVIDGVLDHSPGRACPPAECPGRIAHARVHAPAVRGAADRRPRISQRLRLRLGGHARAAGPADLRSHRRRRRRPGRGTRPPGPAGVRQGHQGRPGPAAPGRRPGH